MAMLHDWNDRPGWAGMHHLWIAELLRWIKPRLPDEFRAYIGSAPLLAVGAPAGRPDVGVLPWTPADEPPTKGPDAGEAESGPAEPDEEVAVATLAPEMAVCVERRGRLVAAVELVSPGNKDRPFARGAALARYLGYVLDGAHLVLIDVHRRPSGFSFADGIAEGLQLNRPPVPPPMAVSYRVGEPSGGGRFLAIWRRPMAVGAALPTIPLPLTPDRAVDIDLDRTYGLAADDAYLAG